MEFKKHLYIPLMLMTGLLHAETLKQIFNPAFGGGDFYTQLDSDTLPGDSTNYIQNNPSVVQVATMSITGVAQEDHDLYTVYPSSPSGFSDGNIILAKDPSNTLPCIFFFYGGARYHMCGCPETGPSTNSGQCQGFLCGVTYP